jgi:hypothetical protein
MAKKDKNWIQGVDKEMAKKGTIGAFTKQAKRKGLTPVEFAKQVLANPDKYYKKTRERAMFVKNTNPEKFEDGGTIIVKGNRVRVVNTPYDGQEGIVVSNDTHNGNYMVQLGDGKVKGIKKDNLMLLSREVFEDGGTILSDNDDWSTNPNGTQYNLEKGGFTYKKGKEFRDFVLRERFEHYPDDKLKEHNNEVNSKNLNREDAIDKAINDTLKTIKT